MFAPRTPSPSFNALAEPLFFLCVLAITGLMFKALADGCINLAYTALAAAASAVAYYVRPYGLFLFGAMVLVILLATRKSYRTMVVACSAAGGSFFLIVLPGLYARYAAFGSPFDYGANSKYFVAHYKHVWAENIASPSLWEYLTTHDWGDYYWKFVHEGLEVVLYYLQVGLLPLAWVTLAAAGAVTIFLTRRRALYFVPVAVLVSIAGMSVIFHVYGSIRHLLYLAPLLLILAGAFFFVLERTRFRVNNIAGTCMILIVIATTHDVGWWRFQQLEIPQVKDHWAVWAAENLSGNVAIVEGGDLLKMSEHYASRGWRIARDFQWVEPRISTMRPGVHRDLTDALEIFKQRGIRYVITDDNHVRRRPYLREASNAEWVGVFKHLKYFRLGDKGAVLKNVNIYELIY